MFRTRSHRETPSRPTAQRGSVGSARVWDDGTRARRGAPEPSVPEARADAPAPVGTPLEGVGNEELAALVAGIVRVTLDTRLGDYGPARREALVRELEARLRVHFGLPAVPSTPVLEPRPTKEEDGTSPDTGAAEDVPAARTRERVEPPLDPLARALWTHMEERLTRLGGELATRADVRQRLLELALSLRPALTEKHGEDDGEAVDAATGEELSSLDLLQRRAAKLERSLAEARAALAYVSGLERVESGIASIYRAVQGLGLDDPLRESKRGLLQAIFNANLSLQKPGA